MTSHILCPENRITTNSVLLDVAQVKFYLIILLKNQTIQKYVTYTSKVELHKSDHVHLL